jgi:hypothetical protein
MGDYLHDRAMKTDNLSGLTPIAILSLSAVLAAFLVVSIPILLAPEPLKVSDWLGFAGAIIGAFVTLAAAIIAWRAVQAQIETQRVIANQQAAIQSYGVLHDLAVTLENELRLALELGAIARSATLIDMLREQAPVEIQTAALLLPKLDEARDQLKAVRKEWAIADTKRWQFRNALDARMEFEGTLVELAWRLETAYAQILMVSRTDTSQPVLAAARQKILDNISFSDIEQKVRTSRTAYTTAINAELARLLPKLDQVRSEASL